jgi:ribosome-binding protein aMBF1 (putative translation factor)
MIGRQMRNDREAALEVAGVEFIGENGGRRRSAIDEGPEIEMNTGEQIKTAREGLGWSRAQLAREAGMTVASIADFENGKKRLAVIAISMIARILRTAEAKASTQPARDVRLRPAV